MSESPFPPTSPRWGVTIKIVIGLSFVLAVAAIIGSYPTIIGPLLLAIILTYFLHPLALRLSNATRLSWRASVGIIYLLLVLILIGFSTAIGFAVVGQIESLYNAIRRYVSDDLPRLIASLADQTFEFGIFQFDLSQFNINDLGQQLLNNLQTLLGRAGGLVSAIATGAFGTLGWTVFVLLVSYFILADAGQVPDVFKNITVPGYDYDMRRLGRELGRTWNAYLRGQTLIIILVIITASIILTILGVRFALGIALITGLARFVPYVGPLTVNLVLFLVTFFQPSNYFGFPPIGFAALVIGVMLITDQIFDNYISPKLLGQTLRVAPAAILVAALILARMIGFVGLVLAAPVLASLKLIVTYMFRKMFDVDPWPEPEMEPPPIQYPWVIGFHRLKNWVVSQIKQRKKPLGH